MPITYEQARRVIEQHLAAASQAEFLSEHPDNPFSSPVEPVECAILDSETIETEWGYVFFYQSKQYVETGEVSAMLAGNAPLVVLKETGDIHATGTAEAVDHYLKELEGWLGVGSTPRRRPDVEVELTMTPTAEGGRKGPAFSGYRPHFAMREDFLTSGQIDLVGREQISPSETAKANITFLSVLPHSVWQGRVLRAQEGAKVVGTAKVVTVFNPVLAVEEPLYEVLLGAEVLGRSSLTRRDPGMAVAAGRFLPTFAFAKVEDVFALFADAQGDTANASDEAKLHEYYRRRDALQLRLRSPEGAMIDTEWIHIADFRAEIGPEACELEVHLAGSTIFDRIS
jgi:elongation factor Tu